MEPRLNDERLDSLEKLTALIDERSLVDYEFKRAALSLSEDLQYVSHAIRGDAKAWRLNRAFHAVHVPSLLAIMSMLKDIDEMKSVSDEERHQINTSINRAAQLASSARERIERSVLAKAKVELSVLADYAPTVATEYQKASLFERTRDGVLSASNTALQKAKDGVEIVPGLVGTLKMVFHLP